MNDFDKFDKWFLVITVTVSLTLFTAGVMYTGIEYGKIIEAQGEINKGLDLGE